MSQITYRFTFNKELFCNIREFSKLHSNDTCDEFMHEFTIWIRNNKTLIDCETSRLENFGFKGDIEKKIYKSARYYFKNKYKKQYTINNSKLRKPSIYISRNPMFLKLVETYISNNPMKASLLFNKFINDDNETIQTGIKKEVNRLSNCQIQHIDCLKKIHKTFNNAYYKIKKSKLKQQLKQ